MKKPVFTLLLTSLAVLVFAQTELRWDAHGVGFTVPSNFKVEVNNGDEFTASNRNISLTIVPIQDAGLTEDNLADAVIEMAKGMEYDVVDEVDAVDIDDFTGYFVKGRKEGVNAVVMALLDRESSTNLLVAITYTESYFDDAVDIANSFFAYD